MTARCCAHSSLTYTLTAQMVHSIPKSQIASRNQTCNLCLAANFQDPLGCLTALGHEKCCQSGSQVPLNRQLCAHRSGRNKCRRHRHGRREPNWSVQKRTPAAYPSSPYVSSIEDQFLNQTPESTKSGQEL